MSGRRFRYIIMNVFQGSQAVDMCATEVANMEAILSERSES